MELVERDDLACQALARENGGLDVGSNVEGQQQDFSFLPAVCLVSRFCPEELKESSNRNPHIGILQ